MRSLSLVAFVVACFALVHPAIAQNENKGVTTVTPVFGQTVSYTMPDGFLPVFSDVEDGFYIQESVLEGETFEKWSQMVTLTGVQDLATKVERPLEMVAEAFESSIQSKCPETFSSQSLGRSSIDDREAIAAWFGCGSVDSAQGVVSETVIVVFIKGERDVYNLQWAERSAAHSSQPVYDDTTLSARLVKLLPIRICDIVEGEAAPYPSCIER